MNIKNVDAERLARELAALTGESLTMAVTIALRERLQRLGASSATADTAERAARILGVGRQIAPRLTEPWASEDHGDLLYDDAGLPQ